MCQAAIATCHQCEHHGKIEVREGRGVVPCTVNGRDIVENASARDCPLKLFPKNMICEDPTTRGPRLPFWLALRWWLFRRLGWCIFVLATALPTRWIFVRRADRGAGDTIARIIHRPLQIAMRAYFKATARKSCPAPGLWAAIYRAASGDCATCGDMQGKLNEKFPYSPPSANKE